MQQTDNVWSWSEKFTENLERLMREPQTEIMARWDWSNRRERLGLWRRQIDVARELYLHGNAEALRVLCDYWGTITDDVYEQARFARESYHQFPLLFEHLRKKPAKITEWRAAESHLG